MIVLKILLYILLAVLGIILIILITPAGAEFSYIDGKFSYKVKLWLFDIMNSEGGGLLGWWKKRKANKKDKPSKPKKPKPVKMKKAKKKKEREKYEWEKELDEIPVNDPEADTDKTETADPHIVSENSDNDSFAESEEISEENSKKEKKKHRKKKKDESLEDDLFDDAEDEKKNDDDEKKPLSDKIEFIVGIWESAQRPMLKIFKGFKLRDLYIDFVIADEDAYDCALKYGKFSTLIYNGIAFFSQLFTVRLKTIDVQPAFGVSKGRWDAAGKLYFRLGTMVIAGVWFLITYIFRTFIPEKLRKRKMKKSAARQK
ncbi:hypothetical protein [Ruminococcus flavefaciens]|uniref:hypothetical protein n=1 Tax=Ruminococcus flavefaciens TaxID=1265 RepID=UPI0026EACD71|nr:hypothetical protein [Ruminococcus flavefaciens]MDD7516123.1 hypothetical protein [Ruminococcus flavefaciens]MDY5692206.1 hypothetical protein [Ruminococcus flavefaciens]